jgi:hypothetical protein
MCGHRPVVDRTLKILSHGAINPLLLRWVRGRICTAARVPLPLASKRFEHFHFLGVVGAFENGIKKPASILQVPLSLPRSTHPSCLASRAQIPSRSGQCTCEESRQGSRASAEPRLPKPAAFVAKTLDGFVHQLLVVRAIEVHSLGLDLLRHSRRGGLVDHGRCVARRLRRLLHADTAPPAPAFMRRPQFAFTLSPSSPCPNRILDNTTLKLYRLYMYQPAVFLALSGGRFLLGEPLSTW